MQLQNSAKPVGISKTGPITSGHKRAI